MFVKVGIDGLQPGNELTGPQSAIGIRKQLPRGFVPLVMHHRIEDVAAKKGARIH